LGNVIEKADPATTSWLLSPPVLHGELTVVEQAVEAASAHGLTEPPELADFVVDLLDADPLLNKRTWHFSRGEQQIAGLILAFARPFQRLILIDPTAGLDPRRSRDLAEFLIDLEHDVDIDVASESEVFCSHW
jgi:ABC-type multidrug transport system ATPase subunit